MTTAVVERLDLQILGAQPAIAVLVLDACIGKLHVSIVLRKVVLHRPTVNLFRRAIGPAVAVRSAAVPLLEELLVLALEFVVEDDAADAAALAAQAVGGLQIRAVDLRVVGQLAGLVETRVEPLMSRVGVGILPVSARPSVVEFTPRCGQVSFLPRTNRRAVVTFQDVSPSLGQNHERAVIPGGRRDVYETRLLEVSEVARSRVQRTFLRVAQVAGGDHAEGANDGERARL